MSNILIVECSRDDDTGEMAKMAASIEAFQKGAGHKVTRVDMEDLLKDNNLSTNLRRLGEQDQLVFTGHSRFFESQSRFQPPARYVVRPLAERTVGGYDADTIVKVVVEAVTKIKTNDIMFCACEIATNVDTHERDDNGKELVILSFPKNGLRMVRDYAVRQDGDRHISLLFNITAKVQSELQKVAYYGAVVLKGLNGVGYIVEDNPKYLSFSQEHLFKYETICKRQKNRKTMLKDDEFLNQYVLDPTKKASAHVLGFKLGG